MLRKKLVNAFAEFRSRILVFALFAISVQVVAQTDLVTGSVMDD